LVGDTTYSDYGLRIIRGNGGANADSKIQHRGTGALVIEAQEAAPTTFFNGGSERARIDSSGTFRVKGAGTAGVNDAFAVNGSAPANSAQIDSSGRLLVGTSTFAQTNTYSTAQKINVAGEAGDGIQLQGYSANQFNISIDFSKSRGASVGTNTIVQNADSLGNLIFNGYDGSAYKQAAKIEAFVDGTPGADDMPGRLVFSTTADGASSPTERMRILNNGVLQTFNSTGGSYEIRTALSAGTADNLILGAHGAANVTGGGTASFVVRTNGNVENTNNSYGAFSDIKLKKNIVDANSQWNDLKALQVRNYNLKEGQTHTQIGLVAQEVELVSPGLVTESPDRDEDGNDLGTVTKSVNYSVLYMKAVKALQEAMERIETLEAKVAALEAL
jgi:hypothetical protein